MDINLVARIVRAARNPETVAPRNGHKESDIEWAERVVGYVLAEANDGDDWPWDDIESPNHPWYRPA